MRATSVLPGPLSALFGPVPLSLAALLLLVFQPSLRAQTPAATPLDPDVTLRIDSVFLDLDRTDSPGCALGVVRAGTLVYATGYGSANLDHEIPITPHTVFYMGSVSKQFTAGAVALAARLGHLSLDDDIRRWIPELPDYGTPVTIRHLVHHTSGLRDYLTLRSLAGQPLEVASSDEETIGLLARQRALNFEPGERYLYSNSGYFLLSEIVERATGLTLREFGELHFFHPLGMWNSHFHDDANHVVRYRATAYSRDQDADGFHMNHSWTFAQVGSGGLYSNVLDLARWDANYYTEEAGGEGFTEQLLERGVLADGDTLPYAFGLTHGTYRGLRTVGHGGSLAGFRTHLLRFPDERTTVLALCNLSSADPGRRARAVADIVLADRLASVTDEPDEAEGEEEADEEAARPEPPTLTAAERRAYEGAYHSDELPATYRIEDRDGGLIVIPPGGGERELRPTGVDTFRAGGWTLTFRRDDAGRVTGFVLDAGRALGLELERRP